MSYKSHLVVAVVSLLFGISCATSYKVGALAHQQYQVHDKREKDPAVLSMVRPYKDSINHTMNSVIGINEAPLEKQMPRSTLGYFMSDAFLVMGRQKFQVPVDIAIMNYGGIRLTQLPAGKITVGHIFELMPFDNVLVLQKLKGSVLLALLDHVAARGGWPVAGMTMQIKDKKAVNVMIGGKKLDPDMEYTMANSDYVANGGDDASMLRGIPQQNRGYLMRNALIDYINLLKSQGNNVSPVKETRVTNVE